MTCPHCSSSCHVALAFLLECSTYKHARGKVEVAAVANRHCSRARRCARACNGNIMLWTPNEGFRQNARLDKALAEYNVTCGASPCTLNDVASLLTDSKKKDCYPMRIIN
jgi:hypothetical protein